MTILLERRHLRRALGYVAREKALLVATVVCGILGFLVTFIYPWLIGELIDRVIAPTGIHATKSPKEREWDVIWITAVGAITPFLFAFAGYGRGHFNYKMGNRIVVALRRDLFRHFQKLSLSFFAREQTGSLVWRLMHEVHGINGLVHAGVLLALFDLLQVGIAIVLLLKLSPILTFAVGILFPFYLLPFKLFNGPIQKASDDVQQSMGRMTGSVQEAFSGMSVIKAFTAEERKEKKFLEENENHYRLVVNQSHLGHLMGATSETFVHMGTAIIIGYGGYLALTMSNPLTAGELTRFIGYVGILYGPLRRFAELNTVYQNSLASVRRIFSIFDIVPKVTEREKIDGIAPSRGEVEFRGVSFSYERGGRAERIPNEVDETDTASDTSPPLVTLEEINLKVSAGERVALVGPSGSGKSTLVSLIPRLYDVDSGWVLIDGVDVKHYPLRALREAIAVVHQDAFLFSGTIRDNIAFGREGATDEEVHAAAKAANAHHFIMEFKNGYDTVVGERGITLSGGQRQRVTIARALLRNPKILILDEATSSLDTESEFLVQQALERLMEGRTCFIIAHRLSTIRSADRIFLLNKGKITESGGHSELLFKNGHYAKLVSRQADLDRTPLRVSGAH